jgi:hypothetical protein
MMLLTPLAGGAVEIGEEPQIPCANLDGWSLRGAPPNNEENSADQREKNLTHSDILANIRG